MHHFRGRNKQRVDLAHPLTPRIKECQHVFVASTRLRREVPSGQPRRNCQSSRSRIRMPHHLRETRCLSDPPVMSTSHSVGKVRQAPRSTLFGKRLLQPPSFLDGIQSALHGEFEEHGRPAKPQMRRLQRQQGCHLAHNQVRQLQCLQLPCDLTEDGPKAPLKCGTWPPALIKQWPRHNSCRRVPPQAASGSNKRFQDMPPKASAWLTSRRRKQIVAGLCTRLRGNFCSRAKCLICRFRQGPTPQKVAVQRAEASAKLRASSVSGMSSCELPWRTPG